jgi:hypothetical protein
MSPPSHRVVGLPATSAHLGPMPRGAAEPQRRRRRKWLLLLLLLLSAVPSIVTTSITISMFSARSLVPGDTVGGVEVDVEADPPVLIIASGMLPGDSVRGSLRIENRGERPLRYAVTSTSSHYRAPLLAAALIAEVRSEGSGCAALDGTVLYRGPLSQARVGDPAIGGHPGDRRLGAREGEILCLVVTLPRPVGDAHQGSAATAVFTVSAEEER